MLGTGLLASQLPHVYAQDSAATTIDTVWSPPVAPVALLGVAVRNGTTVKKYPYRVKTWNTPDQLRAGLANKTMPVTVVPSYVSANVRNRGQDVILFNILTFGLLSIIGRDQPIASLAELQGKTLLIPFKSDMPDLVLQALFRKAGLDFSRINVQYLTTPPEALGLFLAGKADYAFLPEPMATAAILKGKKSGQNVLRVIDVHREWGRIMGTHSRIPQAGLQVTRVFYDANRDFIDSLQQDLEAAVGWIESNPRSAAEIATSYLPTPAPVLEQSLLHSNLTATRTRTISTEIMLFFEELYRLNPRILGGKMPDEQLFGV
ncbi:MAG: hypothetical protein CSA09_03260 [Candidatus Contendobacter odensis]|uniref:ABC transporter substrate-binding protein n=1 Tax=Candidatus Contendibacter odensensis TaxID=1400860 RepID=A0A2G6PFZ2_9GAMM|nr:MAG: hypothetical protein CSA09_03260 [Candidatus Contendobacter odensis]